MQLIYINAMYIKKEKSVVSLHHAVRARITRSSSFIPNFSKNSYPRRESVSGYGIVKIRLMLNRIAFKLSDLLGIESDIAIRGIIFIGIEFRSRKKSEIALR